MQFLFCFADCVTADAKRYRIWIWINERINVNLCEYCIHNRKTNYIYVSANNFACQNSIAEKRKTKNVWWPIFGSRFFFNIWESLFFPCVVLRTSHCTLYTVYWRAGRNEKKKKYIAIRYLNYIFLLHLKRGKWLLEFHKVVETFFISDWAFEKKKINKKGTNI